MAIVKKNEGVAKVTATLELDLAALPPDMVVSGEALNVWFDRQDNRDYSEAVMTFENATVAAVLEELKTVKYTAIKLARVGDIR